MIGQTFQNRYRLDAELGQGGMGVVYRAHDSLLDRDVAVKILNDPGLGTEGRARLLREARAVARLNHPNIVGVYDAGEAAGAAFIIMEYVEGHSLYQRPPETLDQTLFVARQICAALEHAHAHGIIHRDLKPENVVMALEGTVKLMDFGLARSMAAEHPTSGGLAGTVFYIAREIAQGRPADGRADLYALGVILYEWATGRLPFDAEDPVAVLTQHIFTPVTPPTQLRPEVSPALEAIILKLLAKDPQERFASAGELGAALDELARGRSPRLAPAAPRHNLPIHLTSFIGREKEIADVKQRLSNTRLLTLTGPGGAGKTRLAQQVAAEVLATPAFPDGAWLVELASLSDPALVAQSVAGVLGVRDEPDYPLTRALADMLHHKSLLLILDNGEHLIEACAELAEALLRVCPGLTLLVTSREALGIGGESVMRVPPLSSPDPQHLPPLEALGAYEAIRLFVERASRVRPDFRLTQDNASVIAQICRRLDGLPLALELAAARVRAMTVEQIAARLDDRFRLLTGGSRTALPRQQTLRALIDWSWDLLTEAERALLRRLSVFWGGWMLEAAEVVGADRNRPEVNEPAATMLPPANILDLLTHLVDKSLVTVEDQGGETRYRLLETIRQYTGEKLLEAGEAEGARDRHLDYFLRLSHEAEPLLRGADQLTWLMRLEIEHDNLRAALKWAMGRGLPEASLRLAGNLARFWYLHGYWREGRDWLTQALSQTDARSTSPALRAARAKALAGAAWLMDEDGNDIPLYEASLTLYRELEDGWGQAFALRGLGATWLNQGNAERAAPLLDESLALFRELGDPWGTALALCNLGWLVGVRYDVEQAQAGWDEGLRLFRQSGDRWGIAVTLGALSYLARLKDDYARAVALSEESLTLFRELGDKAGIAVSLTRLGHVAYRRSDYRQATALIEEGIALQRDLGDQNGLAYSFALLGLIAGYQGEYARATAWLEDGLALSREIEDGLNAALNLEYLGFIAYLQGDQERAQTLCDEGLTIYGNLLGDKSPLAAALLNLGRIAYVQGDYALALEKLESGLDVGRTIGDQRYVAGVLDHLGRVAQAQGDTARARALLNESLSLRKKLGDKQGLAESLESLGHALAASHPERAVCLLGAAETLREVIGAPRPPVERGAYARTLEAARAHLGETEFRARWDAGRAMTVEQVIDYALAVDE